MVPNWMSREYTSEDQQVIFELIKSINQGGCRDLFGSYCSGKSIVEIAIEEYEAFKNEIMPI